MADQHHNGEFESKEVLFKQASIEWEERASWAGDFTFSLGTNEAGTRDVPESTSSRDSLSKKHKLATRDNVYTIKAKQELEKGTTWDWQIDHKKKSVEGSNDDSGVSTTLTAGYVTPLFGVKTTFGGTYEDTNLNGSYKDTKAFKSKLKVDYPIPIMAGVMVAGATATAVLGPSVFGRSRTVRHRLGVSVVSIRVLLELSLI